MIMTRHDDGTMHPRIFYGSHWIRPTDEAIAAARAAGTVCGSPHVSVWLNQDGSYHADFNLSDHHGPRAWKTLKRCKAIAGRVDEFQDALQQALSEARANLEYTTARYRESSYPDLCFAFLVTFGRGGSSIYQDEERGATSTLSGYRRPNEDPAFNAECDRLQIPVIDSTTIPDSLIRRVVSFPMYCNRADERDASEAPYGGLSYAPMRMVAALYKHLGATVRNVDPLPIDDALKLWRPYTAGEVNVLQGFQTSNPQQLMQGLIELREERKA